MRTVPGSVPTIVRAAAWLYVLRRVAIGLILLAIAGLAAFMIVTTLVLNMGH
jgi:hypothetical protein